MGNIQPRQRAVYLASTTAGAPINVPHGTAPTTPVDGDLWTTTAGLYARVNGATVGPFGSGGGATVSDTAPSSPTTGQIWLNSVSGGTFIYYDSYWIEIGSAGGQLIAPVTITGTAAASTPLTVQGASGQTADVVTVQNSSSYMEWAVSPGGVTTSRKLSADLNGPIAQFAKARGSGSSPALISAGDQFGSLAFFGHDGSAYRQGAVIIAAAGPSPASGSMPGILLFYTTPSGSVTPVERLRISETGAATFTGTVNLATGTSSLAPLDFTAGPVLGTAQGGTVEFDGDAFYGTPDDSAVGGRAVLETSHFYGLSATRNLTNGTGAQSIFGVGITLAGSTTYEFEMEVAIACSGTTTAIKALIFGGTATLTSIGYSAQYVHSATSVATTGALNELWVATAASTNMGATGTTNYSRYRVRGLVRVNASGTFIPQVSWSAAPGAAPVVQANSFIKLTPVGNGSVQAVGAWA